METKDYFENRALRIIEPDLEKSKKSLEIAKTKLDESKKLFSAEFYDTSFLTLYTSMFHAAKAILYKDGIQEKSHHAVYIYLTERYSDSIPKTLLNFFNQIREERHEILYGFEGKVTKQETEDAINSCEEFLEEINKILEENET
jgi:uncharacterized protein (UPF0332 family)